jgi:hypothetical protein
MQMNGILSDGWKSFRQKLLLPMVMALAVVLGGDVPECRGPATDRWAPIGLQSINRPSISLTLPRKVCLSKEKAWEIDAFNFSQFLPETVGYKMQTAEIRTSRLKVVLSIAIPPSHGEREIREIDWDRLFASHRRMLGDALSLWSRSFDYERNVWRSALLHYKRLLYCV